MAAEGRRRLPSPGAVVRHASALATFSWRYLTADLRAMPDFVIVGAARSGTTSLYRWLATHPDVAPAWKKEIHYFDEHYGRGCAGTVPTSRSGGGAGSPAKPPPTCCSILWPRPGPLVTSRPPPGSSSCSASRRSGPSPSTGSGASGSDPSSRDPRSSRSKRASPASRSGWPRPKPLRPPRVSGATITSGSRTWPGGSTPISCAGGSTPWAGQRVLVLGERAAQLRSGGLRPGVWSGWVFRPIPSRFRRSTPLCASKRPTRR